jgi:hypothetical protein
LGINIRSKDEQSSDGSTGKKASSMLMVEGVLYMWVRNANSNWDGCQIAWPLIMPRQGRGANGNSKNLDTALLLIMVKIMRVQETITSIPSLMITPARIEEQISSF